MHVLFLQKITTDDLSLKQLCESSASPHRSNTCCVVVLATLDHGY